MSQVAMDIASSWVQKPLFPGLPATMVSFRCHIHSNMKLALRTKQMTFPAEDWKLSESVYDIQIIGLLRQANLTRWLPVLLFALWIIHSCWSSAFIVIGNYCGFRFQARPHPLTPPGDSDVSFVVQISGTSSSVVTLTQRRYPSNDALVNMPLSLASQLLWTTPQML